MEKLSNCPIIIPAYNEEDNIRDVVERARKHADVCVVDDGSKDATPRILSEMDGTHVITHTKNTHIPGAVLDGMRYAVEQGYEFAVTIDAGMSHEPDEIPRFMAENADLVIGSRVEKIHTPVYRRLLSLAGNFIYNITLDFPKTLFKRKYYKDITSGFRRYSNRAMKLLISSNMESKSFDFLIESAVHIYKNGMTISEVPITYKFTGSSLRWKVVSDCISMCMKFILHPNR